MAGRPIRPRSPLIRPTSRSISSRRIWYCSTCSRDGHRHLDEDGVLDVEVAVVDELAERAQPGVDALGVVEPVHAEEDLARVAQRAADLLGPRGRPRALGELLEAARRRWRSGTPRRGRSARRAGRRGRGGSCARPAGAPGARSSRRRRAAGSRPGRRRAAPRAAGVATAAAGTARPAGTGCAGRSRSAGRGGARAASAAPAAAGSRAPRPGASSLASSAALSANRWLTST